MEKRARKILFGGGAAATAAAATVAGAPTANAATFAVTNLLDSGPGSLRQAIIDANAAPGSDQITFDAGLTGTIVLTTGQLDIADSVVISGPGAAVLAVSGNDASRVFYLYNGPANIDVSISGLTVRDGNANIGAGLVNFDEDLHLADMVFTENAATGDGGALWLDGFNMQFDIVDTVISGNSAAADGGGVYIEDTGGPSVFQGVTISGNTAADDGGGIYFYDPDTDVSIVESTISGNSAGDLGGGVYMYDTDGGQFVIDRSTISGNTARSGGGLFLYGPDTPVTIINTTVSGNTATEQGGGIFLYNVYQPFTIAHSTIANNSAATGGGIRQPDAANLTMHHSIVAGNTAATDADINAAGAVNASFSLIGVSSGLTLNGTNNVVDVAADLGPLANNGGPTQTHLPNATSPAIDAGDAAISGAPTTDQRGVARILNGTIDIGAVEVVPPPVADSGTTPEDVALNQAVPGVLANDVGGFVPTVGTGPASGTVVLNADGSYVYTPNANFNGADSFTYQLTGLGASAALATVSIQVTPVNDAPVAAADSASATGGSAVTIPVLGNDSDVDGDTITITAVTQGTQGTVAISGGNVIYTPSAGASGTDTFTYTISDGTTTAVATVTVTIAAAPTTTAPPTTPPTTAAPLIPATGKQSGNTAAVATGTLILGAALMFVSRRRHA